MGKVPAGKTTDIPIESGRNMIQLVKNRDQFLAHGEIKEAGNEKIDDIEHFIVPVDHRRHGAGKDLPSPPDFTGMAAALEAERVNLRIGPVNPAAAG